MCQVPRDNCLSLPFLASELQASSDSTLPCDLNCFPSPRQAHDASRMWTSVLTPYPVAPMVPVPTCQGASGASAMGDILALSVIRTLMTVTPVSTALGGAATGNPAMKSYYVLRCCHSPSIAE